MNEDKVQEAINNLYTDLYMLYDGEWKPEPHSVQASIDGLEFIAEELDMDCADFRE